MPSNANKGAVKCEIALVRYMQGQLQQARDNYQEAASMETNSITAFEGN